ncbi:formate dehydrogenase accessory sulfurtransferase FdhD [Photobacterium damselae]|uniref:formate dehydrogenase accessory sulfurtransferase FdhD n=1 Tax=Photobacterium damselae TaxID=38293 RepID=UPI00165D8CDB|nr:formate dehydrogenase accessory sulfurtransferase FdhD [Photobacterium damselae]
MGIASRIYIQESECNTTGITEIDITRYINSNYHSDIDYVAREVPISISYNGISYSILMATPINLYYFAVGFSLSEQIINDVYDIKWIDIERYKDGVILKIELKSEFFYNLKKIRRSFVGISGCGLCGIEHLSLINKDLRYMDNTIKLDSNILINVFEQIKNKQDLFDITGCTHSAMLFNPDGVIKLSFEDIARHVALDKLIGGINVNKINNCGGVFITSRISYEIIQKIVNAKVEILVAVSAPTDLAINLANKYGLTLIGFFRDNSYVVYTHKTRVI